MVSGNVFSEDSLILDMLLQEILICDFQEQRRKALPFPRIEEEILHKGAGGSFACRAKAVAAAACALHGVSATWISLKHLHDLRSRYMAAMRVDKPGSNSFLQLHLDGFGMDPCAFAILQTIRDFRDLGSSDWHLDLLGQVVAQPHNGGQNAVTRVLQKRIELLGWQFVDGDKISDDL